MTDNEERKRRKREEERKKQELRLKQKRRSLHDKHRDRRKKDCMIGLPFIIAFQGDPAGLFYCADIPNTFELIPRTKNFPNRGWGLHPLARLKQYMKHHIVNIAKKVLVYKAN